MLVLHRRVKSFAQIIKKQKKMTCCSVRFAHGSFCPRRLHELFVPLDCCGIAKAITNCITAEDHPYNILRSITIVRPTNVLAKTRE